MKRKFISAMFATVLFAGFASGCSSPAEPAETPIQDSDSSDSTDSQKEEPIMNLQINDQIFTADLSDTTAASELAEQLSQGPIRLKLHEYGGFEKTGSLGRDYTADDTWTEAGPGDLMLYQGNEISVFYGSNSWSYTPLGRIRDLTGWKEALGTGDTEILLSLPETES